MTDHPKDPLGDPFDILRTHVRAVALLERPTVDADELVADITGSIDRADRSRGAQVLPLHEFSGARSPRRRRWFTAAAAGAIVAVGGASVAAYVALRPSDPTFGILCRESADTGSSSVQLSLDDDPITACANAWKTGDMTPRAQGQPSGFVPELVACTGGLGAIDVLPIQPGETCETYGLDSLRSTSVEIQSPVDVLSEEVAASNAGGCRSGAQLQVTAADLVERLGLSAWRIETDGRAAECSVLAIDLETFVISVRADPFRSTTPEEIP